MRNWFKFQAKSDDSTTVTIDILDVIGSWDDDWFARNFGYDMGVTARQFVEELAKLPADVKALHVRINSPGGDVQAGINIANALRDQQISKGRTVETFVDGIAASIASVIAMAGSKVHMGDNALMMIHEPWGGVVGNAAELRKTADVLDTMRGQIVNTYKWHAKGSDEDLIALMEAETWMNADEAITLGLATDKIEGLKAAAVLNPKIANLNVPDRYRARVDALLKPSSPAPAPPEPPKAMAAIDVIRECKAAGLLDLAEALIGEHATADQVSAKISRATQDKAIAEARIAEITALCQTAKLPELAQGYINGHMTSADVSAHLVTITAKLDTVQIDAGLPLGDDATNGKHKLNPRAVYARRNGTSKE